LLLVKKAVENAVSILCSSKVERRTLGKKPELPPRTFFGTFLYFLELCHLRIWEIQKFDEAYNL